MEISLIKLFSALWKKWYIILALALIFAIVAYAGSILLHDDTYTASATVLLRAADPVEGVTLNTSITTALKDLIPTYMQFFREEIIIDSVREEYPQEFEKYYVRTYLEQNKGATEEAALVAYRTKYPNGVTLPYSNGAIQGSTTLVQTSDAESLIFTIRVTLPTAADAVVVTNTLAEQSEQIKNYLPSCEGGIVTPAKVATLNQAASMRSAILGFALGALASALGLALYYIFNTTIRTKQDLKEIFELPIIGSIPFVSEQVLQGKEETDKLTLLAEREAYYSVRANLSYLLKDSENRAVLFTSTLSNEEKTQTMANTAIAVARAGKKVLLLDADFYQSGLQGLLNLPSHLGLADYLAQRTDSIEDCLQKTAYENLDVIGCGAFPSNAAELLMNERIDVLLKKSNEMYDYVFINTSPIYMMNDAVILAPKTAGVVLVVRANTTKRTIVTEVLDSIDTVGANLLGMVWRETQSARVPLHDANNYQDYSKYYNEEESIVFLRNQE